MKKSQTYSICLKTGEFKENPTFKLKLGKTQRTINPYIYPYKIQHYNYELIIDKLNETQILFECYFNDELAGTGKMKIDSKKNQQNQKVQVVNTKKTKIGVLDCSIRKIQKKVKRPALSIEIIQASYEQDANIKSKSDSFVVVKHGDTNFKTDPVKQQGKTPVWKKSFLLFESEIQRVYLQCWEQDQDGTQLIGLTYIDIDKSLGSETQHDVIKNGKKVGKIKINLQQRQKTKKLEVHEKMINDKNYVKKRTIKVYAVQAIMKDEVRKGAFIRLNTSQQQFETTPIYLQKKDLQWNQAFTLATNQQFQILRARLCIKDDIEEQLAMTQIQISKITNKRYQLALTDSNNNQLGKVYLEFFDQELDIKEDINKSQAQQPKAQPQQKKPSISEQTASKISSKASQLKARYANRQGIHDYMANVNAVLQEGLLKIAKERPQDPIKQLGLFLINYNK